VISFRYHIVSIIAVFLALAIGIVVGTTALNGPVTQDLRNQVKSLKSDRAGLSGQVKGLQSQVDNAGQFAATFGTALVKDRLKDQHVLMIVLPGATTGMQDALANQITAAGAALTGKLQFTNDFIDQAGATSINSFVTSGVQPSGLSDLPTTADARVLAASLLSYVLVGKGAATDLTTVLTGFASMHMTTGDPASIQPSTNVVVVGTGSQAQGGYSGQAELDLVSSLQAAGAHVVVAGDNGAAKPGGIVGLVRSGSARSNVSTVDDADAPFGPASVVLVLQGALNSQIGHYGTAKGADSLFPNAG
jgi:hypothetical protein